MAEKFYFVKFKKLNFVNFKKRLKTNQTSLISPYQVLAHAARAAAREGPWSGQLTNRYFMFHVHVPRSYDYELALEHLKFCQVQGNLPGDPRLCCFGGKRREEPRSPVKGNHSSAPRAFSSAMRPAHKIF